MDALRISAKSIGKDFCVLYTKRGVTAIALVAKKYDWNFKVVIGEQVIQNGDLRVFQIDEPLVLPIKVYNRNDVVVFNDKVWLFRDIKYNKYRFYTVEDLGKLPPLELLQFENNIKEFDESFVGKLYDWIYGIDRSKKPTGISSDTISIEIID